MKLEWKKRGVRKDNDTSRRMLWASTCGRYHVLECKSRYKLPTIYYALGATLGDILSRHRTRSAAERACNQDAKQHPVTPTD